MLCRFVGDKLSSAKRMEPTVTPSIIVYMICANFLAMILFRGS
jgi:hypothetical protein